MRTGLRRTQERRAHDETRAGFAELHQRKYLPLKCALAEAEERCGGLGAARREAAEQAERWDAARAPLTLTSKFRCQCWAPHRADRTEIRGVIGANISLVAGVLRCTHAAKAVEW